MRKTEKIQTIKEMATEKKESRLSKEELKLIKSRGFSIAMFLASHCAISIFTDDSKETVQALEGIARKLDRRIIKFEALEEILGS